MNEQQIATSNLRSVSNSTELRLQTQNTTTKARVFKFWIGTCWCEHRHKFNEEWMSYYKGQQELSTEGQKKHWQFIVTTSKRVSITFLKKNMCNSAHFEATRSDAAHEYVHKEETAIEGTRWEEGNLPIRRNNKEDWKKIKEDAVKGKWDDIPENILIRNYNNLRNIHKDFSIPTENQKQIALFWGKTGTGKTRRAYDEAKDFGEIYWKDAATKWWDGYQNHKVVIIDDFDGMIPISYLLRWLDRYPVDGEIKGGRVALNYETVFITSNKSIWEWYPKAKHEQVRGLIRRITEENIIYYDGEKEHIAINSEMDLYERTKDTKYLLNSLI